MAVCRDGMWYIRQSSNNQSRSVRWDLANDAPVPADYDGDGAADIAVKRGNVWYLRESLSEQMRATQFGSAGDTPVQAAGFLYSSE